MEGRGQLFDGVGDDSQELLERSVQNRMDLGQAGYWNHVCLLSFHLIDRTENTLTFETFMAFKDYLEQPEITLRLKNIATYVDGKGAVTWHDSERTGPGPDVTFLRGPMDFTFTLGEPIRPIHYQGPFPPRSTESPSGSPGLRYPSLIWTLTLRSRPRWSTSAPKSTTS